MTREEFEKSLLADGPPAGTGATLEALWWDGKGEWERAHECAQAGGDGDAARVHAYLHRKEGDPGNAAYWYSRAGDPEFRGSLKLEWETLVERLLVKP
jgi:hypothetical protein